MEINRVASSTSQSIQQRSLVVDHKEPGAEPDRVEESHAQVQNQVLTKREEEFFVSAFPSAAKEIRQYVLYQKSGGPRPPSPGSVIDRRG